MTTINVFIKNTKGKQLALNILETCTINEGKKKVGLSENNEWKFNGMVLNGSKTFKDYEMEDGDVIFGNFDSLNVKEIKVAIINMKGEKLFLTVLETCTINEGKKKFGLSEEYVWKFDGMVLNGSKTFKDYEMEDGDVIQSSIKI